MNCKYIFFFLVSAILLISCKGHIDNRTKKSQKENILTYKNIELSFYKDLQFNDSVKCNKNKKFLITFNGNCSGCILHFLEWSSKLDTILENKTKCVFISFSRDLHKIKYHIERHNIKLNKCQILIADSSSLFLKKNPFIDKKNNVLLLTKNNNIIKKFNFFAMNL
jgi:hypothetical protein